MGHGLRILKTVTILMAVLIVAGTAVLVAVIVRRSMGGSGTAEIAIRLDEPEGTRIAAIAGAADRLAVQLQGGGPDRVVLFDPRTGTVAARIALGP
ncbi:MAG: hypothetical protein JO227_21030 [Acetobacteraceae bacterium]|nr:hypothetical protein [Acetobacteraceae bacterium]